MKVGIISTEYLPVTGGAQTYLENLIKIFEGAGHKTTVYQFNNGESSSEVKLLPHKPNFLPGGRALDLWWFNLALLAKIPSLAKEDMLIVNYAFHSWPVFWHKRVIVLSHGCEWDIPPTSMSQRVKIAVARWSFRHFKYLVANDSNYFRQMGINLRPKEKMFQAIMPGKWFLPNAVDISEFKKTAPYREFKDKHVILVPRNISWARGIHLSIQAFAIFQKTFPKTILAIVGSRGDSGYQSYLEGLVRDLKLTSKVKFFGNISWQEMPGVYSGAEMVVIPTLQREGTSLAALEAMATGVATVSTDRWGLADLPTVQAEARPEALAEAMVDTYRRRGGVSRQQQETVRKSYNLEIWGKSWLKVIGEAAK